MATYKVPQNVETDDKLIGPLSLKQFIFVILGLGSGYLTFFFATKIHILACIPFVPFTGAFLILGLYQRDDQPVEVYLASAIRFRLKPHKRIWDQEGYEERVIITAPPKLEKNYTKGYNQDQVSSHLGNLSRMMDTRGWASKLAADYQNPALGGTAGSDRLVRPGEITTTTAPRSYEQPVDVQDENSSMVARDFDARIQQVDNQTHQKALIALERARQEDAGQVDTEEETTPTYKKYPEMHQKTITPVDADNAVVLDHNVKITAPQPSTAPLINPPPAQPSQVNTGVNNSNSISSGDEVEITLH